jgi:hypothetical protein
MMTTEETIKSVALSEIDAARKALWKAFRAAQNAQIVPEVPEAPPEVDNEPEASETLERERFWGHREVNRRPKPAELRLRKLVSRCRSHVNAHAGRPCE